MRLLLGLAASSAFFFAAAPLLSIQPASAAPIQCPDTWTGNKCEYYQDGYKAGRQDRKAGLSMAYERHNGAYDSQNASYYQAGYEDGWQSVKTAQKPVQQSGIQCPDTWTGNKCDYYKDGYKAGRQDRKANMSMFYGRHSDAYDSRNESYYQAGYEAGWSAQ